MARTRFKWHRLLVNPTTRMLSVEGETTRLQIDGLVCSSVCAVRTTQALRRIDGVRRVAVDFDTGVATIEGAPQDPAVYERAVTGVVAGKPVRRAIERVATAVRGRVSSAPHGVEAPR
jgi:copper chaperone CopZ